MYYHTDINIKQTSKYPGSPCGDVAEIYRDEDSTYIIFCDGIGSGVKANLYAHMYASQIKELIKSGRSVYKTFFTMVDHMNKAWKNASPFSVFTIAQILSNGKLSVFSYEMPPPLLVGHNYANILKDQVYYSEKAIISEAECIISEDEGILLVSDGITQAGMGLGLNYGWEIEGVSSYLSRALKSDKLDNDEITSLILKRARKHWKDSKGDDCSVIFARNRRGVTINVLSGPPKDKDLDPEFVKTFMNREGIKIICGGTTSQVVAREIKSKIEIEDTGSAISPPKYKIDEINMATEGIVTLNQVYNILDKDIDDVENESPVYELAEYFKIADKIIFQIGDAPNLGFGNIQFLQQGILDRSTIVNLIANKLRSMNKLVIVK